MNAWNLQWSCMILAANGGRILTGMTQGMTDSAVRIADKKEVNRG